MKQDCIVTALLLYFLPIPFWLVIIYQAFKSSKTFATLQAELVEAAQAELREKARKREEKRKGRKAKQHETAAAVTHILAEEDGFQRFTARLNRMFEQFDLSRPTVQVEFRDISVTTQVSAKYSFQRLGEAPVAES
jgi:sRNA-binding protein